MICSKIAPLVTDLLDLVAIWKSLEITMFTERFHMKYCTSRKSHLRYEWSMWSDTEF